MSHCCCSTSLDAKLVELLLLGVYELYVADVDINECRIHVLIFINEG